MDYLKFFVGENLAINDVAEAWPWDFKPDKAELKAQRRKCINDRSQRWNVYTAVRGVCRQLRISKTNPPAALRGLIVDYDMMMDMDTIVKFVGQMPPALAPNFVEISLGGKVRLVWVFEKEILVPSPEFCDALLQTFHEQMQLATLLPGYDKASLKPAELWTNGGIWHWLREEPLAWDYCFGIICTVSKKTSLFNHGEIPLETIAAEVVKKFPGRWQGDFILDARGVRFWDPTADNPTGCQVKPDGMLCFTGKEGFVRWVEIFGKPWCDEKRVMNLGRAAEGFYFDGTSYWEQVTLGSWKFLSRTDVVLALKNNGLSDRVPKGATVSDVDRVLRHIQGINRVDGAAPLINYPPGIVNLQGRRILNMSNLQCVQPVAGPTGVPEKDFPFINEFLEGFFARQDGKPLEHFLAWLERYYRSMLKHLRLMGQAVFICGPGNNGKTLLCMRIVAPLVGDRTANPMPFFTGQSAFNDELFGASLLAVNDEDSPSSEASRLRMLAKIKGSVVNPSQTYHAKFKSPVTIDWTGRIMMTLNDDPGSVGILPEVNSNTRDKLSFYASQAYTKTFPPENELEVTIARELPFFGHWLLNIFKPSPEVLCDTRMGVKSYFDPVILDLSNQQSYASNLAELIVEWIAIDAYWGEADKNETWQGTPTKLLTTLQSCPSLERTAGDWNAQKISKSLAALARQGGFVEFVAGSTRDFIITSPAALKKRKANGEAGSSNPPEQQRAA